MSDYTAGQRASRRVPSTRWMLRTLLLSSCAAFLCAAPVERATHEPAPTEIRVTGAPASVADTGWIAGAQQAIAALEYRASHNGTGVQAPNRAHNLRTYFDASGVRVHDRTASGTPSLPR